MTNRTATFAARNDVTPNESVYSLVRRGDINPAEVEELGTQAVEVTVLWKTSILHVTHLDATQGFVLATEGTNDATRLVVDESMLPEGVRTLPVVTNDGLATRFVFAPGATGEVESKGARRSVADLAAEGAATASSTIAGAFEMPVREGAKFRMEVGGLTLAARVVAKARKATRRVERDRKLAWAGVGALVAVAGLVGAMQLNTSDSAMLSASSDEDRIEALRDFLARQNERAPEPVRPTDDGANQGALAHNNSGGPTNPASTPHPTNPRPGVAHNPNRAPRIPSLGNPTPSESVTMPNAGIVRIAENMAIDPSGTFRNVTSAPTTTPSADGTMNPFGDPNGVLSPYGATTGGGPEGGPEGPINVGTITTRATCRAGQDCSANRIGLTDRPLGDRPPQPPHVTPGPLGPTPGIDSAVIRRVVQRNLGQIAHCHEQGLAVNPNLAGRVAVRFVIAPNGTVMAASVASTNVSVAAVNSCIAGAVRRWTFPIPPNVSGPISVTYPFVLTPAQ